MRTICKFLVGILFINWSTISLEKKVFWRIDYITFTLFLIHSKSFFSLFIPTFSKFPEVELLLTVRVMTSKFGVKRSFQKCHSWVLNFRFKKHYVSAKNVFWARLFTGELVLIQLGPHYHYYWFRYRMNMCSLFLCFQPISNYAFWV